MTILKCEQISLSYERNTVLSELSFSVSKGDYLCIVGENGSGKSTLLKALLGLHPLTGGKIVFDQSFSKKRIAYLAQQNEMQKEFPASVYEVVLSGRLALKSHFGFYRRNDREAVDSIMKKLEIKSFSKASFSELSGGQQQRVLLARALASEAEVLFVDEPTKGLDLHVTAELYRLLSELHKEGKTVVMVTHDVGAALENATHILHLQNKPLFFGTRDEYLVSDVGRGYLAT